MQCVDLLTVDFMHVTAMPSGYLADGHLVHSAMEPISAALRRGLLRLDHLCTE